MQTFAFLLGVLSRKTSVMLQHLSPHPSGRLKKTGTSAEKNRTKPTKDLTAGIRARCERRPCWGLAVSIMEEWAVALTWGFIRWVDSGAFCRRHARPLGLRLTSRYGGSPRYSTKARTVRSSHWSNGKKCTGHRFSHYSTRLQTKARQGGWKKKKITLVFFFPQNDTVFL